MCIRDRAHPYQYNLGDGGIRTLATQMKEMGMQGLEVYHSLSLIHISVLADHAHVVEQLQILLTDGQTGVDAHRLFSLVEEDLKMCIRDRGGRGGP